MTRRSDDGHEMPQGPFDDDAFDAMLRGTPHPEGDVASFASFVEDVRAAAGAVPIPSAALAAALASGISPSAADPQPRWRKLKMKIQGFLAGLSVAGKCALGVGVAAAATTGAGAAGVLPGPVQHAFSKVMHTVTPFESEGGTGGGQAGGRHDGDGTTTATTPGDTTSTSFHDGDGKPPTNGGGDGGVTTSPTTTDHREGDGSTPTTVATTPTTEHIGDGGGGGGGDGGRGGDTTTTIATTPTTEHHSGDGDNNNPESLTLNCVRNHVPASVTCTWSASSSPDHSRYYLLRVDGDGDHNGRVVDGTVDGLTFTDTTVVPGQGYGYRVISVRSDNSVESHSPMVTLMCCGDA